MTENGVNSIHLDGVCRISRPHGDALPLIFDSPHSGTVFPPDFKPAIKREQVLSCADLYVDRLFLDAPLHGAVLLAAEFPRVYVDANRAADDVAPDTVADWSGPARPTEKAHLGKGLVWLAVKPDATPVYKSKLTAKEIQNRIEEWRVCSHGDGQLAHLEARCLDCCRNFCHGCVRTGEHHILRPVDHTDGDIGIAGHKGLYLRF